MSEVPQPNLDPLATPGPANPELRAGTAEGSQADPQVAPPELAGSGPHDDKAETNEAAADLHVGETIEPAGDNLRETSEAVADTQPSEHTSAELKADNETVEADQNSGDGKPGASQSGASAVPPESAGEEPNGEVQAGGAGAQAQPTNHADLYQQEEAALQAEEHVLAIRTDLLELDQTDFQLQRRKLEARLRIGQRVYALQQLRARPGTGDFVKNITRAGLAVTTAYRYRDEYLASLQPPTPESFPNEKDPTEKAAGTAAMDGLTAQGQVQQPNELNKGQDEPPKPSEPKKHPVLKYSEPEWLEFEFYIEKLSQHFVKEIPSRDFSHVVLAALRAIANECNYHYERTSFKTAA
jgi:hypothetical protein